MSKLPSLTARQVVRALKRAGFVEDRQKGSYLLRGILRDANLSTDEFIELL